MLEDGGKNRRWWWWTSIRECNMQYDMSRISMHGYMVVNLFARSECANDIALIDTVWKDWDKLELESSKDWLGFSRSLIYKANHPTYYSKLLTGA